jgi:2-C-methyl-D-erythritol 4-phosphate cytidylyltransferase
MIAVGLVLAGPDGAARLERLTAADLHTAVDGAIAAGGPESAIVVYDPPADADLLAEGLAILRDTGCAAVVAAAPQTDTLKLATPAGFIERTVERSHAYELRSPQLYRAGALRAALDGSAPEAVEQAIREGDHAVLPGLVGGGVRVLPLQSAASSASARVRSTG